MTQKPRLFCAAIAFCATALPLQSAVAACTGAFNSGATWHLHVLQVGTTDGSAVRCVAKFGAAGNFTGPCTNFEAGDNTTGTVNVSGKMTLNAACDFTGTVSVPGDAIVIVKYGHINGNVGSAIGTQGTGAARDVIQVNLIKK